MTNGWNFADIWESNAARFADSPAQIQGERVISWADFERRAEAVSSVLAESDLGPQAKVTQYLHNCPEYLESMFASFKRSFVPVNTNYRYLDDELAYLWDDADVEAVVFHGTFNERCERMRQRVRGIKVWLWVDDQSGEKPPWALDYEKVATSGELAARRTERTGNDQYMLYTGGTTGFPKGVMWRQDDVVMNLAAPDRHPLPDVPSATALQDFVRKPAAPCVPCPPLMHGTGAFVSMHNLIKAGCTVTLEHRSFDVRELLSVIGRRRVGRISVVGDPFCRPILDQLDSSNEPFDLSSLKVIQSSGALWSEEVKQGLLRHKDTLRLVDILGSSESLGGPMKLSDVDTQQNEGFTLSDRTRVISEDGKDVIPGSGEKGRIAIRGRTALGYYKSQDKTAQTFVMIDGERLSVPGDWAEVLRDGTLKLLGRGSNCINSGGEKIFPEEVEEVILRHPSVADAVVVGVPDARFGEAVTAVVALLDGAEASESDLIAHVKGRLASYKAPKRIIFGPVHRFENGKADLKRVNADVQVAISS
jgi:3-oxocholest-4-en-26-oate---CoA ligase